MFLGRDVTLISKNFTVTSAFECAVNPTCLLIRSIQRRADSRGTRPRRSKRAGSFRIIRTHVISTIIQTQNLAFGRHSFWMEIGNRRRACQRQKQCSALFLARELRKVIAPQTPQQASRNIADYTNTRHLHFNPNVKSTIII